MSDSPMPAPRRPRGDPLDGSDRAIEQRAGVDAEDIAAAVALWHRTARPAYRGLIDARATKPQPGGTA